ncbi:hypothetical protein Tco_0184193 [Tanacetum coccineum]
MPREPVGPVDVCAPPATIPFCQKLKIEDVASLYWMDDLGLHISSSGSSTPLSSYPGTSTCSSYSPGTSRSAQNLGKAECLNCEDAWLALTVDSMTIREIQWEAMLGDNENASMTNTQTSQSPSKSTSHVR